MYYISGEELHIMVKFDLLTMSLFVLASLTRSTSSVNICPHWNVAFFQTVYVGTGRKYPGPVPIV